MKLSEGFTVTRMSCIIAKLLLLESQNNIAHLIGLDAQLLPIYYIRHKCNSNSGSKTLLN
jgi:hypothetical protein